MVGDEGVGGGDGIGSAASGPAGGRPGDGIDSLVERALAVTSGLARRGSTLTTGVAVMALVTVGLAYVFGLAAFDGGARTAWAVLGAVMLVVAVGAPLLASVWLRALPRGATRLAAELRTLLGRDTEAQRLLIDTVEASDAPAGGSRSVPQMMVRTRQYGQLRTVVRRSRDVPALAAAFRRIASVPVLVATGLALTGLGSLLGFVFLLIWIF